MDHIEAQRYERIRHRHARRLAANALGKIQEKKGRADEPTEAERVRAAYHAPLSYQLWTWFPLAHVLLHFPSMDPLLNSIIRD